MPGRAPARDDTLAGCGIRASAPPAAGGADHRGDEAERKVGGDDHADLRELGCGRLGIVLIESTPKAPPGCEVEVQKDQDHDPADDVHDVDVHARPREPAEPVEQHEVARQEEGGDARPDPDEEALEHAPPQAKPGGSLDLAGGRP